MPQPDSLQNIPIEGLPENYNLAKVDPKDIKLLDNNARFMTAKTQSQLTANVERDNFLSSVPLCILGSDGGLVVLSGNHRVISAQQAGLEFILIYWIDNTDDHVTDSEQIAIQLSHNSLVGEDDPVLLKELWDTIGEVDMKLYAGFDDDEFEKLATINIAPLSEVSLEFRTLTFMFLPEELDDMRKAFDDAMKYPGSEIWATKLEHFDESIDALSKIQGSYSIKNVSTAMMVWLDIVQKNQQLLAEGWVDEDGNTKHNDFVPISSILGGDVMLADSAITFKRAVDRMLSRGEIKKDKMWLALEILAAKYLEE